MINTCETCTNIEKVPKEEIPEESTSKQMVRCKLVQDMWAACFTQCPFYEQTCWSKLIEYLST
jgi:hypothetical protein